MENEASPITVSTLMAGQLLLSGFGPKSTLPPPIEHVALGIRNGAALAAAAAAASAAIQPGKEATSSKSFCHQGVRSRMTAVTGSPTSAVPSLTKPTTRL